MHLRSSPFFVALIGLFLKFLNLKQRLSVISTYEQGSRVQALLVFSHVVSEDEVAGFPGLFVQPHSVADYHYVADYVCGVAVLALFLSHRQVLLGFVHAASENGLSTYNPEVLVFSRSFHSNYKNARKWDHVKRTTP